FKSHILSQYHRHLCLWCGCRQRLLPLFHFPYGKIAFVIYQRRSCLCSSKKEQGPICTIHSERRELYEQNIRDNSAHNKFKNTTSERRTKTYENSITNR